MLGDFRSWGRAFVAKNKDQLLLEGVKWVLLSLLTAAAASFMQPGPIRDIGILALFALAIVASTVALVRSQHAPPVPSPAPASGDQFQQRVMVYRGEVDERFLNEDEPYLLFAFWLLNGSNHPVYLKGVNGYAKFTDKPLTGRVELRGSEAGVASGDRYRFVIFQAVSKDAVKRMADFIQNGNRSEFCFDSLSLWLTSPAAGGAERRLDLPTLTHLPQRWEIKWA